MSRQRLTILITIVALAALVVGGWYLFGRLGGLVVDEPVVAPSGTPAGLQVEAVAEGLEVPWEVAFTGEGRALVTERVGRVRVVEGGRLRERPVLEVPVVRTGEGGLLGLAVDPDYERNRFVYLFMTVAGGSGGDSGSDLTNRIVRYRDAGGDAGGSLVEPRTVLDGIPGAPNHDGGRLAFGPDGKLYVTTGDAQEPSLAQDRGSLAGKILRVNSDGSVPADNPFGNAVYSYGHRNPQGLAWNADGELFATEHGPSGDRGLCCRDEVNRIERGGNYGWPEITGGQTRRGTVAPVLTSGDSGTWAPAGAAFGPDGLFYFAALRGRQLHAAVVSGDSPRDGALLGAEYGRLRAVVLGPDGALYVTTSNRDGRGDPQPGDDKLLKVTLGR
jgi:glucose/arabinose dehydrogenase